MKYFTKEWAQGEYSNGKMNRIRESYWRHLRDIQNLLPPTAFDLAINGRMHDGLFRKVIYNKKDKTLTFQLRCGDLQIGYFDLDVTYKEVIINQSSLAILKNIDQYKPAEILYHEMDILRERFIHKYLISTYQSLEIIFSEVSYSKQLTSDRRFERPAELFSEI